MMLRKNKEMINFSPYYLDFFDFITPVIIAPLYADILGIPFKKRFIDKILLRLIKIIKI